MNKPLRVVIGSDQENPTLLSACEWFDVFVDQQRQVRRGVRKNGVWHIEVAAAGQYQFELRRWPREANLSLTSGLPEIQVTDGVFEAGVALPIASARLRVGDETHTAATEAHDNAVTIRKHLPAGHMSIQTWFLDDRGEEICGAYYLYVEKL